MIQWISIISASVIAFVALAMVIVLSVFNGIEGLVVSLYNSLEADIEIAPANGLTLLNAEQVISDIAKNPDVIDYATACHGEGILQYEDKQWVVKVLGVSSNFNDVVALENQMQQGSAQFTGNNIIVGAGINYHLRLPEPGRRAIVPLLTVPKGNNLYKQKQGAFTTHQTVLTGVFGVNAEYDLSQVFLPLGLSQKCFGFKQDEYTKILISTPEGLIEKVSTTLQEKLGEGYLVSNRIERRAIIYQTSQSEKWITFIMLVFILIVAAFNIVASLTMLMLNKKTDTKIMQTLGLSKKQVMQVFFYQSLLINCCGGVIGVLLGVFIVWLQDTFGLVKLTGTVVEYYPVELRWEDLVGILSSLLVLGLISYFPVQYLSKRLGVTYARL